MRQSSNRGFFGPHQKPGEKEGSSRSRTPGFRIGFPHGGREPPNWRGDRPRATDGGFLGEGHVMFRLMIWGR